MKESERTRQVFAGWWSNLQPLEGDTKHNAGSDRATLARLRRSTVGEAMADPAVFDLYRRLDLRDVQSLPWVATAAVTLAFVRTNNGVHPTRAVGCPKPGDLDKARMKPLRLRRMLNAREPEEVAVQMRRMVQLAENALSPGDLGHAILIWAVPKAGDAIRARWAFEYYRAGDSAPVETPPLFISIQEGQPA